MRSTGVPLSVLNRALELFGCDPEPDTQRAWIALRSAEGRKDVYGQLTPFAQALAEYISLSGPWNEDTGEYAGQGGHQIDET
jgi:hypothetical protein